MGVWEPYIPVIQRVRGSVMGIWDVRERVSCLFGEGEDAICGSAEIFRVVLLMGFQLPIEMAQLLLETSSKGTIQHVETDRETERERERVRVI